MDLLLVQVVDVFDVGSNLLVDFVKFLLSIFFLSLHFDDFFFEIHDRAFHQWCHFAETERVIVLGQDARLRRHALEVRPENHAAVILKHEKVRQGFPFALHQVLPDAYANHSDLHRQHDYVREDSAHHACALDD